MPPAGEYQTSRHKIVDGSSAEPVTERSKSDIVRFFSGMVIAFEKGLEQF